MTRLLEQVTALHACTTQMRVHEHLVGDDALHRFSTALNDLHQALGDSVEDDQWRATLAKLRRLRFDLLAAPVSPQPFEPEKAHQLLFSQRLHVELAIPSVEPTLARVLDALEGLRQSTANPLLDTIGEIAMRSGGDVTPILICESRLRQACQTAVEKAGHASRLCLMTAPELRGSSPLDSLVIIGAPRWFPAHVFTAPRSTNLFVIRHRWISVDWKSIWQPPFEVAQSDEQPTRRKPPVIQRDRASLDVAPADDLLPELDVRPLLEINQQERGGEHGQSHRDEDEVDAIVLKLEGANFVLMENEEGNQAYIVDLDEDDPIHRVPVREVAEGVFILLRTEGGGDYVVDMANHLLREKVSPARAKQELWKQGLREAVAARGADAVVTELKKRGSSRANTSNLRNWQSPRNIRTQDRADFDAILSLSGLADQRDDFWQTMELIDRAHSRAGQEIRRRLLAEVKQADRGKLIRHGRLGFELDEGGGSLTAFRVEEVLRERQRALRSQLDQVLSATQTSHTP